MVKILIVCEGKNDRIFLNEILTRNLSIPPSDIKWYDQLSKFELDSRNDNLRKISIIQDQGYPQFINLTVRLIRQFWYELSISKIGIFGDSDRGHIFSALDSYLTHYLETPCKKHNFNPSLEKKFSILLKELHHEFRSFSPHEVIDSVQRKLNITLEDLIIHCVELAASEQWFTNLIQKLREKINSQ